MWISDRFEYDLFFGSLGRAPEGDLPTDDAVGPVLEDHRNEWRAGAYGRLRFLYVHQEASIAAGGDDAAVALRQLRPDGPR
jgi:hypothetical protein